LMDIFEAEGIKIFNNITLKSIENIDRKVLIKLEVNGKSEEIFTEKIVFAIGRVPNIKDIGLEEIEVEVDKNGFIKSMKRTEQTFQAYGQ
jgi:pyruvate/2-oxoglutarate dehydrogenase complex dihydrolipoamide dehydrogenase (E3) component